jgi:hypothetical protein
MSKEVDTQLKAAMSSRLANQQGLGGAWTTYLFVGSSLAVVSRSRLPQSWTIPLTKSLENNG